MQEMLDFDQIRQNEKRVKEGLEMTAEDLEKMNFKLMRENENYIKAYQALQKDLHEAKAPGEVWISKSGPCYHRDNCGHMPVNRTKHRKCKDCMPG